MQYSKSLSGEAAALVRRMKIGATLTNAGQVVIRPTGGNAEITDPSVSAAADAYGVALESATYSTTQGTGTSSANVEAYVVYNPFAVFRAAVSGASGDNEDVAMSITENDVSSANGGIDTQGITDADLPSDSMVGGWIYALNGANRSQTRLITTFVSAGTAFAAVPFDRTIASGDDFLIFAASPVNLQVALTTNFTQVPQWWESSISTPAGIAAVTVAILVDDTDPAAPTASLEFVFRDHIYNPLS